MKQKIALIGGGGHCKSCIDVIESSDKYEIVAILDHPDLLDQPVLDYVISGSDDSIALLPQNTQCLVTVGQLSTATLRKRLFNLIIQSGLTPATIVSPNATVSKYAQTGEGTIIHHSAVVNADANIGKNCIINTFALIEHDVRIGDHTHISTGARINGGVSVGEACFVGSGAILVQGITITDEVIIGAGSVVTGSITEPGIYYGNPAKKRDTKNEQNNHHS